MAGSPQMVPSATEQRGLDGESGGLAGRVPVSPSPNRPTAEAVVTTLERYGGKDVADHSWHLRTAANGVTITRLACTPLLVVLILRATPSWAALFLWAALAGTDFADGWLARRRGTTASGAFLDPLADKFLVLGALAAMVARGTVTLLPVALLASRELAMTWYRVVVARHGISVPARRVAKVKTAVEFLTIGLALLPVTWSSRLTVSHASLWVAVGLAWASGAQYLMDTRSSRRAVASSA
jgi:CDP-diacylglycerol--glycerol-3-phosphate 3-phosphatidyltransferase